MATKTPPARIYAVAEYARSFNGNLLEDAQVACGGGVFELSSQWLVSMGGALPH
jgi:hypothetical protein